MKTKSLFFAILLITVILTTSISIGQEKASYGMAEITYMLPKIGMEKVFEDAVKIHNEKYHKEGPFKASLDYILTGKEAGWYVWIMGPCTFSDLDNRPNNDAHRSHWDKTISPKVMKYGRTEYWKYNDKLSFSSDGDSPKYETIWFVDIKRGEYYKFKEFITKVKKAHEKKGEYYSIYNNEFNEDNGRDVAIVWPFNNWASFDVEDGGIKKYYEEIYGVGSWGNALKDWANFTVSMRSQVWRIGVN